MRQERIRDLATAAKNAKAVLRCFLARFADIDVIARPGDAESRANHAKARALVQAELLEFRTLRWHLHGDSLRCKGVDDAGIADMLASDLRRVIRLRRSVKDLWQNASRIALESSRAAAAGEESAS